MSRYRTFRGTGAETPLVRSFLVLVITAFAFVMMEMLWTAIDKTDFSSRISPRHELRSTMVLLLGGAGSLALNGLAIYRTAKALRSLHPVKTALSFIVFCALSVVSCTMLFGSGIMIRRIVLGFF